MRYTMTLSFAVMVVFWKWDAQISYSLLQATTGCSPLALCPHLLWGGIFNKTTTHDGLARA